MIDVEEVEGDLRRQRLSYLVDMYKLYHGHMNSMFNYFLILAGLIATAYVQSSSAAAKIDKAIPACIALFGALMSYISLRVHQRSRQMIDTIENGLREEEKKMFKQGGGFLNAPIERRSWLGRHKYQFPLTYWAFISAFSLLTIYAWALRQEVDLRQVSTKLLNLFNS